MKKSIGILSLIIVCVSGLSMVNANAFDGTLVGSAPPIWKGAMICKPSIDNLNVFDWIQVGESTDNDGLVRRVFFFEGSRKPLVGSKCRLKSERQYGEPVIILSCVADDRSREIDIIINEMIKPLFGRPKKYAATLYVSGRYRGYDNKLYMSCMAAKSP